MQLSNSGRVVVIDDLFDEAKPLIETFGRKSIPYLYYDGSSVNLPDNPPEGIRFVFLDIELSGMEGLDDKTKASGLTARLLKIISKNNGPYVIVFWTKHKEIIEQVIDNCKAKSIAPVVWLDMEKTECIDNNDGTYDIQKITDSLQEKLLGVGAFHLYVEWENIVNNSTKLFISEFSSFVPYGENWSNETSELFYNLYKTYVEKNEIEDSKERIKCACYLMNRSFLDTLEILTCNDLSIPDNFKLTGGHISEDTKAKLNTSLFIDNNPISPPSTGCVFINEDEKTQKALNKHLFKNDNYPEESVLCIVIITPECDIAQNKAVKVSDAEEKEFILHRVVYGLLYPIKDDFKAEKQKLHDRGKDSQYIIGPLWYKERRYLLIVHLSIISFFPEYDLPEKVEFSLKRDLLFDLQSKAANHVNRLGNYMVK